MSFSANLSKVLIFIVALAIILVRQSIEKINALGIFFSRLLDPLVAVIEAISPWG